MSKYDYYWKVKNRKYEKTFNVEKFDAIANNFLENGLPLLAAITGFITALVFVFWFSFYFLPILVE